jgi:hypothetical protein
MKSFFGLHGKPSIWKRNPSIRRFTVALLNQGSLQKDILAKLLEVFRVKISRRTLYQLKKDLEAGKYTEETRQ